MKRSLTNALCIIMFLAPGTITFGQQRSARSEMAIPTPGSAGTVTLSLAV